MIRYSVVWTKSSLDELAELWLAADDRGDVTAAAAVIDEQLAEDASAKGAEVSEGLRGLYSPPVRVLFAVRDEDRLVEVLRVRRL